MSLTAAVVRELIAAGLAGDELAEACERIEESDWAPPVRTARQERNRRYYEARKASEKRLNASYSDVSDASGPSLEKGPAPPDPLTPKTQPTPSPPYKAPPAPKSAREELAIVLDAERAAAVVEHRQRLRKPLTAYAAKRLALKLAQAPDPNAAADAMIENGWQGFEPSWLENRVRPSTGPPRPNGHRTAGDYIREAMERLENQPDEPVFDLDLQAVTAH